MSIFRCPKEIVILHTQIFLRCELHRWHRSECKFVRRFDGNTLEFYLKTPPRDSIVGISDPKDSIL